MSEWYYWHIQRKTQKFVPWVARKLPKKLKYYVVIHGMVTVDYQITDSHYTNPSYVTGMQLLDLWAPD
jgi:hypothetical protein